MESLIFDTTFLIDLQRERKFKIGTAQHFLRNNINYPIFISVVAFGEYGEGFASQTDPVFRSVIVHFEILPLTEQTGSIYSLLIRELRAEGKLIGTNDLWTASVALEYGFPLVTKNRVHFARIPGLQIRSY